MFLFSFASNYLFNLVVFSSLTHGHTGGHLIPTRLWTSSWSPAPRCGGCPLPVLPGGLGLPPRPQVGSPANHTPGTRAERASPSPWRSSPRAAVRSGWVTVSEPPTHADLLFSATHSWRHGIESPHHYCWVAHCSSCVLRLCYHVCTWLSPYKHASKRVSLLEGLTFYHYKVSSDDPKSDFGLRV